MTSGEPPQTERRLVTLGEVGSTVEAALMRWMLLGLILCAAACCEVLCRASWELFEGDRRWPPLPLPLSGDCDLGPVELVERVVVSKGWRSCWLQESASSDL